MFKLTQQLRAAGLALRVYWRQLFPPAKICPIPDCRKVFFRSKLKGQITVAANDTWTRQPICDDCQRLVLEERAQLVAEHTNKDFFKPQTKGQL
jgi:hypothetical protein